jgi:hypothetical protein
VYWGMSLRGPNVKLDGLIRATEKHRVLRDAREYPSGRDSGRLDQATDSETKSRVGWVRLRGRLSI